MAGVLADYNSLFVCSCYIELACTGRSGQPEADTAEAQPESRLQTIPNHADARPSSSVGIKSGMPWQTSPRHVTLT